MIDYTEIIVNRPSNFHLIFKTIADVEKVIDIGRAKGRKQGCGE